MCCRPLLEGELEIQEIAETLWKAPMAILSSNDGDSDGEPPVYKYANEVQLLSVPCCPPCKHAVMQDCTECINGVENGCEWMV